MEIDTLFEKFESLTQKDLKLNFKKFFADNGLTPKDSGLITLACAQAVSSNSLTNFAKVHLEKVGATPEEIGEAYDAAAIMGLMNTYYRFRHYVNKDAYKAPAGLRMNIMAKPTTGKLSFEMMALAVSIINGCEACVQSHEKSLIDHGATEAQVHDLARLASLVKAVSVSLRQVGAD